VNIGLTSDVVVRPAEIRPSTSDDDYLSICVATMDVVASPLYVVCGDGRLLFTNRAAKSCLRQGRWLQCHGGCVNASLHLNIAPSLKSVWERLRQGSGSTVLLTNIESGHQAVVTVAPISSPHRERSDGERLGLIWLTTTSEPDVASLTRVGQIFNLTGAERQLLSELVAGADLREAAVRLKVSIHTVRNQLKSVLSKTGRHSQAQLLTLVTRIASLQLPEPD
jgi:DNA-binding CsgD family transcriptional regulator